MSEPITLTSLVRDIRGVGPGLEERLLRLGVRNVRDLIEFLPRRIEDRSQLRDISQLEPMQPLVIRGEVQKVSGRVSKRGVFIVTAKIVDESGTINAIWFNQRYLLRFLRVGSFITLFGEQRLIKTMGTPFFVKKIIEQPEIAPLYPLTSGLTQAAMQKLMKACQPVVRQLKDVLPAEISSEAGLLSRAKALAAAHFQPSAQALKEAQNLLGYEELLAVCLAAIKAKHERQGQQTSIQPISAEAVRRVSAQLDFELTADQGRVVDEVASDLGQPYPMSRLLYGEVGSGKTAVGLISAIAVAEQGKRALWLSPTTTLAHQQASLTKEFCKKFQLSSALITGAIKEDMADAQVIIGTHALLHTKTAISDVGLVIIDEQQRFGVDQRNNLLKKYPGAHLLMLSATPIPRTLAHTLFGHIDISYLHEKPRHQQPIITKIFREAGRERVEEHIQQRLSLKQPGYVICPLIEQADGESDGLFDDERKAVSSEIKRLGKRFSDARVGAIHGKLTSAQKQQIMEQFREGKMDVLVATSVIEVGIDNPNATWILIEEADRFGLSQLHQLRGRVGRGSRASVCFLHNSLSTERATERLQALVEAENGLEIAELDLRLRGPGEIAGTDQSGLPGIKYANLADTELIKRIYRQAEKIGSNKLTAYPELARLVRYLTKNENSAT